MPVPNEFRNLVEQQRPYLVRFTALQLRDVDAVEDVVQETLLAALNAEASFTGRSNLRTWLTGILKHKIIDAIRRVSRERMAFLRRAVKKLPAARTAAVPDAAAGR
ncbi:MAG: hypothetical protein EXR33_00865 [Betaproteobacteria bacterium]|nr:hypothetical protein [Betaproteobacteria bacterium]